ncbi:cell wall elongation regulator TseB-like domain-containing protein [Lacticaseibacillus sp. GG6-2]
MRRANRSNWQRRAWIIAGLALIVVVLGIYARSLAPLHQVRKEAIAIAEKKADVQDVSAFYWDKQRQSYLTVAGTTKKNQRIYVLIAQHNGHVTVLKQNAGITRETAENKAIASFAPKKIISVGLSQRGKKFVWDVGYRAKSGKLGYVTYDFKSGAQLFAVANL